MILLEKLGSIFCRKNRKHLVHLKVSRLVLKMNKEKILKLSIVIVVENITQKNLKIFVMIMVFVGNLQLLTHHIRMVCQRGRIEPSLTW